MDDITWKKAFNAGRAYQVLARLNVELMNMQDECEKDSSLLDNIDILRTLTNDAMLFLKWEE